MKIDRVEAINLRFEYPGGYGFRGGGGVCTARLTTLILVHTDTGQVGIGAAYSHPVLTYLVVRDQLDPLLRGADPLQVEGLWERMYGLTRWYGRKGAALSALGGVEIALWDLRGKAQDKPLWALLGAGKPSCPVYASGLLWNEYEELAAEAARHLDQGFRRMKMRLGRSEEYDREAVRAVRRAIGPRHDLMADASMRYHLELARRMGQFLGEQKVFWYEEPFLPEDLDAYAALRGTVPVPVAAGENEFGFQGFRELIRAGAVDIVQADACRCGGIGQLLQVAQLAGEHGLRVAPHTWSDAVALTANAQVVASLANGVTVEMDRTGNPFIDELLLEPLQVRDGQLQLSRAPGLGIELDWQVVERLRLADPLHIPDGAYSDMAFGTQYFTEAPSYEEAP